ncbi:MAG TPA: hypothetical protein VFN41_09175 [Candidatus Limnocylindrales bacterium]|nr:hypothetical protein [Candidatus Limnocylindrales bacterium]
MTDARLQSTKPIDDEVPFAESDGDRDTAARPGDALVKPATAEREATQQDEDVEKSQLDDVPGLPRELGTP